MGRCSIASISRRGRLNTLTMLTMAGRIILPNLVIVVCLFVVVVILPRQVCISSQPIQSRNRSRTEHTTHSRRSCPSGQAALRIGVFLFSQVALADIPRRGILSILVSLSGLFSLTIIVGLVILAVPLQPIRFIVSRKAGRSTISMARSRATQSILPSEYNPSMVRAGRRLAPPMKSNNPTKSRQDGRATRPSLQSRTFHNTQSRRRYREIDKTCSGQRVAAL